MKKQLFYAVFGTNGFGICSTYDIAYSKKIYLKKFKIKKFDEYSEACEYAIDGFHDLQEMFDPDSMYSGSSNLKLNFIYYKKFF